MAVVSTKATAITNADASTQTLNRNILSGARLREAVGTIEAANGDSIGSKYFFARVPSNARISRVDLYCDAVTSGAMDVGVYQTSQNGGAVVDADFFGSAVSIATAITVGTNITHESAAYGVEDIEKPLWEALDLSADPGGHYDIVGTLTAATTAAGTVSLVVRYQDGN